ncbi:MAG: glycosyltransferase family 4 protein [Anaerolineales bacterium]|nr:glycosyltransferase family 4 protein [Anaerolineales bacterium]
MKILLITPFYAPDLGPSAPLFTMLCEKLVRFGYKVSVIAAVPHYPIGTVTKEFRGKLFQREKRNGVDVTRVWVPSLNRSHLGQRFLGFVCYQLLATFAGLKCHYDALIISNPAIESVLPFIVLSVLRKKPAIFSVHDIYPDVGVRLGVFKHKPIIKLVEHMERFCLDRAVYVRVLSKGFRQILRTKGVPDSKLVLIWDWVDTDFIKPLTRTNLFSKNCGLNSSFIIMYAGNIGLSQGLEYVIETAKLLAKEPNISFVFVGDGAGKESLQGMIQSSGLVNVQLIPFQPREVLPMVLASADVSLITLKRGVGTDSVPSKCFSILASGRPIIAAVDKGSDTWNLINQAQCGICIEPENPEALAETILRLYHDKNYRVKLGNNGREYVIQHHSVLVAAQKFHEIFKSIIQ